MTFLFEQYEFNQVFLHEFIHYQYPIVSQIRSMPQKQMMVKIQKQKILQTTEQLFQWNAIKEDFLKKHIPLQQALLKNLQNCSQITLLRLKDIIQFIRQEKQIQAFIYQKLQKSTVADQNRYSPKKKQANESTLNKPIWNNNINKVLQSFVQANKQRMINLKAFYKTIQTSEDQFIKQEARYSGQLKKDVKAIQKLLDKIDQKDTEQQKILKAIIKDSKSSDFKQSPHFLTQFKKLEALALGELTILAERGAELFKLMKSILQNQKKVSKKIKDIFLALFKARSTITKDTQFDQRVLGVLALIQDNVADQRKKYFNQVLLNQAQLAQLHALVPPPNNGAVPNLECVVRYLQFKPEQIIQKVNGKNQMMIFLKNMSFKIWQNVELAQGWIITSFTPVIVYLTFDHFLGIFNKQGNLLKKIHVKETKVSKVDNNNVVYLQQIKKGFFSDSKEEYQLKFIESDRMEQFLLFLQNPID